MYTDLCRFSEMNLNMNGSFMRQYSQTRIWIHPLKSPLKMFHSHIILCIFLRDVDMTQSISSQFLILYMSVTSHGIDFPCKKPFSNFEQWQNICNFSIFY